MTMKTEPLPLEVVKIKLKYLPVKLSNDALYWQVDSAAFPLGKLFAAVAVDCLSVLGPLWATFLSVRSRRTIHEIGNYDHPAWLRGSLAQK